MITRRTDSVRPRAIATAVGAFVLFALLGRLVSGSPPLEIEVALEQAFFGAATPVALIFTDSCRWWVLVPLGVLALLLAAFVPTWRARAVLSVALTLVAWQASDLAKWIFARPRPPEWLAVHETSYGYPSGHAMFAVVVYLLWAYFVWRSPLPQGARSAGSIVLTLWALGIIWSRLALGAHYPTDLAGGVLLGIAFVAAGIAAMPVILRSPGRRPIIVRSGQR